MGVRGLATFILENTNFWKKVRIDVAVENWKRYVVRSAVTWWSELRSYIENILEFEQTISI